MDEAKKFKGYWWLPANPDQQWFGTVKWKPTKSPKLKLTYKSVDAGAAPDNNVESFLGLDTGGTQLTVLRAGTAGTNFSGFLSNRKYTAGHIIRGVHVPVYDDFRAHKINLSLQHLRTWVNEAGFENEGRVDFNIQYKRPEDQMFQISEGVVLKVCHSARSSYRKGERSIGYDIFLSIERRTPFDFRRAFRWVNALRNLLHFSNLRPVFSTKLTFEHFDHRFQLGPESYPKEIEFYNGSIAPPVEKDLHPPDFVFTFKDVKATFSDFCARWFTFCVEQREALGCYFTTVHMGIGNEVSLIFLTQALEAFHERRYHPKTKEECHFVNRIKQLCENHKGRLTQIVGDIDKFAESVRDSRHYYTHHDPAIRQKGNVVTGVKLTMMTYHLQFLFRLCVLSEFNLEADPYDMLRRWIPHRITEFY